MIRDNENGFYMPVAPAYAGNGGFNNGFGGDWAWIVLLLLLAGNGGWGFGGGFGGFGMMGGFGGMYEFPWLLAGQNNINQNTNAGFRDAQLSDGITSVRDGIAALSTQLCNCCGNTQMAITNAQNSISQQLNTNEIANLNRSFAEQTANMQGFNSVNAGIADTRYTIATEACATRTTDIQNTQAILTALTAGVQSIKDQLCQDKIDAKDDIIAQLRQENLYARGQASQIEQTARLLAGQANEVDALYTRLSNCPVPSTPVYGRTPIFTCNNSTGCGCNTGCGCGM